MYGSNWYAMRSFARDGSVTKQRLKKGSVRRIASYARPYRGQLALFLTATSLSAVIGVSVPLMLRSIVNGILKRDTALVLWIAGIVLALAVAAPCWPSRSAGSPPGSAKGSSTTCGPRCSGTCSSSRSRSSPGPRLGPWSAG